MKFKGNILEDIDMIYLYEFCRFWYILHINHHSIKNCIHYIIVSFNSWSALLTKIFKFGIKVNCFCFFCFTVREKFLMSDSYYDIDMTFFFSLSWNGIEEAWNSWSFYNFIKFLNVLKLFLLKGYNRCRSWTCSNKKTC